MKTPTPKTASAFTLIELLTVIAIIGILAAILIPTVAKVRQSANRTKSVANLKAIGSAISLYTQEYRDQLPLSREISLTRWWPAILWPYLQNPNVLARPGVDLVNGPGRSVPASSADTKTPSGELIVFTYVVNGGGGYVPFPDVGTAKVHMSQVTTPSQVIAMGEMSDSNSPWLNVASSNTTIDPAKITERLRFDGNKATLLFLDGHVSQMTVNEITAENIFYKMN